MAAMGAALGAMTGWMTYGRRKFEAQDPVMRHNLPPLDSAMKQLISMIDADTNAFTDYMAAMALPQETDEDKAARHAAMQAGLQKAIEVPLNTMRLVDGCWDAMAEMARHGSLALRSDLEVGARALDTGLWGAYRNVLINLGDIEDAEFKRRVTAEAEAMVERARAMSAQVLELLAGRQEN